ncbi:hypothetical protein HPB47_006641 [Ixodes persulcatus]|uniref:Uncharacterized protein n=1 Tax=Ixodes persulcatus TaxID=34615 RepID=A0AC60P9R5_IXOPE|nr:hypothetical protein HPB47_006641 [Ixodes persulcatus]
MNRTSASSTSSRVVPTKGAFVPARIKPVALLLYYWLLAVFFFFFSWLARLRLLKERTKKESEGVRGASLGSRSTRSCFRRSIFISVYRRKFNGYFLQCPPKLQRASVSLLHRLRTGCAFTAKALRRINSAVDPHCPTCDVPEDFDHLLWDCPTLTKERKSLFDGLQYTGVAHAITEEILFPPGPAGTASNSFARLLTFLEDRKLFDRL